MLIQLCQSQIWVTPVPFKQVYVLHAEYNENAHPCIYALLPESPLHSTNVCSERRLASQNQQGHRHQPPTRTVQYIIFYQAIPDSSITTQIHFSEGHNPGKRFDHQRFLIRNMTRMDSEVLGCYISFVGFLRLIVKHHVQVIRNRFFFLCFLEPLMHLLYIPRRAF